MLRPSPNHETLRLPNDDENYWLKFSCAEYTFQVMVLNFVVRIQCHHLCSFTLGPWSHNFRLASPYAQCHFFLQIKRITSVFVCFFS